MLKKINYRFIVIMQIILLFAIGLKLQVFGQRQRPCYNGVDMSIDEIFHHFANNLSKNQLDSSAYFIDQIDLDAIPDIKLNEYVSQFS